MGATAFLLAAQHGFVDIVWAICEHVGSTQAHPDPLVDQGDAQGATPLGIAAQVGNANVIRVMLQCGASVDLRDGRGETALDIAVRKGLTHKDVAKVLRRHTRDVINTLEKQLLQRLQQHQQKKKKKKKKRRRKKRKKKRRKKKKYDEL